MTRAIRVVGPSHLADVDACRRGATATCGLGAAVVVVVVAATAEAAGEKRNCNDQRDNQTRRANAGKTVGGHRDRGSLAQRT